jgi:beta-lactam-binding protein with PASTA domain/tRNA A-37 threonylcarbamoyl transferase component Bud32
MTLQDPLVGRVVDGRYLVESRIARGGMATVYLALDRRLDREVALKVMHEHLAVDHEFVTRFVREARAAARLSHPNVVQVFDQGSDGEVLYLAMEYLPGRTLRDVLSQRGALTPRESVSVLEPVLGALAAAHRAGIVHRDVKPENVILTDDGRIKVADFGLARAITAPISSTAGGELLGTVAYLAPELVSRGVADARADVYAAGIMLFELLTGKQPFTGSDPLQVAYRHVHETVPAPTSLSPELPLAFDRVVLEATAPDPDQRPPDAGQLLADLYSAQATVPDEQLDVRAADAATLRIDAVRTGYDESGAPAAAIAPQPTRTLAMSRRASRNGGAGAPLVPRLRVHDDEPLPPGFLGDRRRQALAAVAGAAVVVLLIFTGVWWFTGGPGSYTDTPALTGARVTDAQRTLTDAGLKSHITFQFSTTVAAGQVLSTKPSGGEHVKKNGSVELFVSKGPQLIPVPSVKGLSPEDAEAAITKVGLSVGSTKQRFSDTVPKGKVISSSPKKGTKIAPDRQVTITVSKGVEQVVLDNVVNQNVDAASALLQSHGFKVVPQPQPFQDGGPAPGTVTAQSPVITTQGQTAPKGSTVTLTVVQQPAQQNVPNVINQQFDQAKALLEGLGFQVQKQGGGFFRGNTVTAQSIVGPAPANSLVILTVG